MWGDEINIKPGSKWLCIRDVVMTDNTVAYYSGRVYKSERPGCITDNYLNIDHSWDDSLMKYFRQVPRNKRSRLVKRPIDYSKWIL